MTRPSFLKLCQIIPDLATFSGFSFFSFSRKVIGKQAGRVIQLPTGRSCWLISILQKENRQPTATRTQLFPERVTGK